MDAVIMLGGLNLILCVWIIALQGRLTKYRAVLALLHEGIRRAADGEVKFVRKNGSVEAVLNKEAANG